MNIIVRVISYIGSSVISSTERIGRFGIFLCRSLALSVTFLIQLRLLLKYIVEMGICALPLIAMTALFTGAVLALQSYTGFSRMHAESAISSIVVISITRELGPVLAGLMLAGRLSASIAAEVGTMRVTEQIDALHIMDIDPIKYLVVPRIIAGMISLPFLVIIADIIGVFGGYVVAVRRLGFEPVLYLHKTVEFLQFHDVVSGLIKALFFGLTICVIGCYHGYHAVGGAHGVGTSTTKAVVTSSIMIFLLNYLITGIMFSK